MADQGTTEGAEAVETPDATAVVDTPPTEPAGDAADAGSGSILAGANSEGGETTDGQPNAGEDTGKGEDGKGEEEQAEGAPETYELKGADGEALNEQELEAYAPLFKEANLSNELAQKFVDAHQEAIQGVLNKQAGELDNMVNDWKAEFAALPDADKVAGRAKAVLDKYAKEADPDTYQFLMETWAGSHPGLVQLFARIGDHVLDDSFDGKSGVTGDSKDFRAVFPSMKNP